MQDVSEDKTPNLNLVQWSETFVGQFERFGQSARYLYYRVIMKVQRSVRSRGNVHKQRKSSQIDNKTHTLGALPATIHYNRQSKQAFSDSGPQWPWSVSVCLKTFWAFFFHHLESVHKVGRKTDQDVLRYPVRTKRNQKVAGRLTFDLLTKSSTCSSLLSSTVGIWSKKSLHWNHS